MKVFLDTNVFYKNWFLDKAHFTLLFYFLNNENKELLLSDLVVQEVNNIRERELNEVQSEILRLISKGSKLNSTPLNYASDSLGVESYDLFELLKFKVDWIERIGYDNIDQKTVVNRALKVVKPFSGQEKGYRDTLIWLSFLQYLKENNVEGEVAFITNNKNDFFESKGGTLRFNADLNNDIDGLGIKANIRPYLNVYDFVNDNVDRISHSFDRHELLDDLEHFLIDETESFFRNMTNREIDNLLGARIFGDKLTSVIDIEADVFEGLEDPKIKQVKRLSGNSVYISSYYEMRRVDLVITIDLVEFKQHADEIEAIYALYNIEIDGDYVKLSFILRASVDGSFVYETKEKKASSLSIENMYNSIKLK